MKKFLLIALAFAPLALFASEGGETDIVARTLNFIIFAAILWYLLADKIKAYLASRTEKIQSELDKVEDTLKASKAKVEKANLKVEEAKKLALEIVEGAKVDTTSIKEKIAKNADSEIDGLNKHLNEKIEVETRKAKTQVVSEVLDELFADENLSLNQDDLANIVIKKVA